MTGTTAKAVARFAASPDDQPRRQTDLVETAPSRKNGHGLFGGESDSNVLERTIEGDMSKKSDKTDTSKRDLILDAAEHLFSQKGFATVTTREIASQANVSLSALPYYFGSKQEILRQVLDRRLSEIQGKRAAMLSEAAPIDPENPHSMRRILEALLKPTFIMSQEHRDFTRLLGAVSIDPNPDVQAAMNEVFAQYPTGLPAELRKSASHLDDEDFFWRFYCILGAMIYIQSDTGRMDEMTRGKIDFSRPQDNLDRIVTFMLWGLAGPPSSGREG